MDENKVIIGVYKNELKRITKTQSHEFIDGCLRQMQYSGGELAKELTRLGLGYLRDRLNEKWSA